VKSAGQMAGSGTAPTPTSNAPPVAAQAPAPAQRFVVFLFDDLNLSTDDLMQVQKASTKILEASLPASDVAAVLSTSGTNSGLTRDRAKLQKAIQDLRVSNLYRHDGHDCPNVDYYQGDLIVNKNDGMALQAAVQDAMSCANLDPSMMSLAERMAQEAARRAAAMGEQDFRTSLSFLRTVVSKMGSLPGQRVLILVSSGFLTPTTEAMTLQSQVLDIAAQSNVTISAIDARGLYTTGLDASQQGGGSPLAVRLQGQYRQDSMVSSESVMAELADGTGGTYFHNNNNLEAGLNSLISGPGYLYLLAFSNAGVKPNGAYHDLKVKVKQNGLSLQARRGYFAPAPDKSKK
jgi:VWFA-related protein